MTKKSSCKRIEGMLVKPQNAHRTVNLSGNYVDISRTNYGYETISLRVNAQETRGNRNSIYPFQKVVVYICTEDLANKFDKLIGKYFGDKE